MHAQVAPMLYGGMQLLGVLLRGMCSAVLTAQEFCRLQIYHARSETCITGLLRSPEKFECCTVIVHIPVCVKHAKKKSTLAQDFLLTDIAQVYFYSGTALFGPSCSFHNSYVP